MIHLVKNLTSWCVCVIMKVILISVLLFFELCSGFTVHKLQRKRSAEADIRAPRQTDVYEVNEGDQHTVKLTHPKPEKPTLREIIYYHLIEYPYENEAKNETVIDVEGSDANGDDNPGDDDDDITQRNEDEENDEQDDSEGEDGVGEYQLSEDGEETKSFKLDVRNKKEQAKLRNVKEYDQNNVVPSDKKKDARTVLFDQAKTKYSYVVRKQEKPSSKRKREISLKDMPPAPTLAPLNLGILPDYIRRLISTPESVPSKPKTALKDQLTHFDEEDSSEELEKKIDAMISSLKPKDTDSEDENDNTEEDDDNDDTDNFSDESDDDDEDESDEDLKNSSNNDVEDENTIIKRIPRTFGMNLTMGRGYVWNDLLSEPGMPGMSFDIGESGHDSENTRDEAIPPETTKKPSTSEKPEDSKKPNASELSVPFEPFTNVPHPTESRPIHIHSEDSSSEHVSHHDSNNDKNANDEDHKGKPDKDLEDIDMNSFKPKLLPDSENSEEKEDENKKGENDKKSKPITTDVTKNKDYDAEEHTLKPSKENSSNHASKHKKDKHKHKKMFKPENDDSLKELMKNEEFWKWLSDWTSTYMELLIKHIKELVHDEVYRQIKALELKKDTPVKEMNERDTKEKEEKVDSHNISCNHSNDDSNSHDDKEFLANKNENSNPDDKTSIHDDGRLIFDGEIGAKTVPFPDDNLLLMPLTHTTNFDLNKESNEPNYNKYFSEEESNDLADFLRNKNHKSDNENRKKPDVVNKSNKVKHDKSPTRISATNIFGNAVGSDKVTNIFVFYPSHDENFEKDSILSSLKPSITGENNIFVSGKPDKVNIDTRVPEIAKQKEESTVTENESNKSTEKYNDNNATPSNLVEKNKDVKDGNTEQDSQTEPSTTTPKENEKTQNASDKIEQENKAPVKEQNTTDQPKDDDLSKDVTIRTTTESANSTETTTVSSLDKKKQEDIKLLDSENKETDELKIGNKTESNTDAMSSVTERNLDNKPEITTDKTDQQDITEHKENHNTEHPEKLKEEQVKEIEEKVAKELVGRISKELEVKLEKELQTKIEQELSKAIEKELSKAKNKDIDKDLKSDESPKEESDKEADKASSEKDSEKKGDKVILSA